MTADPGATLEPAMRRGETAWMWLYAAAVLLAGAIAWYCVVWGLRFSLNSHPEARIGVAFSIVYGMPFGLGASMLAAFAWRALSGWVRLVAVGPLPIFFALMIYEAART